MDAVNPRDVMRMVEQEGFTLVDTRIQWYAAPSLSLSANPPHTHSVVPHPWQLHSLLLGVSTRLMCTRGLPC